LEETTSYKKFLDYGPWSVGSGVFKGF